jgi:hypothetical protein
VRTTLCCFSCLLFEKLLLGTVLLSQVTIYQKDTHQQSLKLKNVPMKIRALEQLSQLVAFMTPEAGETLFTLHFQETSPTINKISPAKLRENGPAKFIIIFYLPCCVFIKR